MAGAETSKVYNVSAQTTLTFTQSATSGPSLKGHPSARWVLGGQDSYFGALELAYVPTDPRPLTGTLTGKLGSVDSALANMRLALGEQEGDSSAATYTVSAESILTLSSTASLTNFSRCISASSTIVLSSAGGTSAVRPVIGTNALALSDLAGTAVVRSVVAESTLDLSDSADLFPWVITEVGAESTLSLSHGALGRHARFFPVAESIIELTQLADSSGKLISQAFATSAIELTSEATGRHARFFPTGESTLGLSTLAEGRHAHFRPTGQSTLALSSAATSRFSRFWPVATSTLSLTSSGAGWNPTVQVSAESTLTLNQTASVSWAHVLDVSAESTLEFFDFAFGRHAHFRPTATSTLALTDSAIRKGVYLRDATSAIQTIVQEYDSDLDELVTTIVGLQDSASANVSLSSSARNVIPLRQAAGAVWIKSTSISVSAESALDLSDQAWKNEIGEARSSLHLMQSATVFRGNPTSSVIELTDTAGVSVVRKRSACSVLELKQSVAYSIVRADVLYKYHPYVGEGGTGAPTPPPATLTGPVEGVTTTFQLFYPATGTVTDSVTLRTPNLGNKDRLAFNRISRETRGGTLIVYADPIWPKIQTLALTFSGLSTTEAQDLLQFLGRSFGSTDRPPGLGTSVLGWRDYDTRRSDCSGCQTGLFSQLRVRG